MSERHNYDAYRAYRYLATYQSLGKAQAAIQRATGNLDARRGDLVVVRGRHLGSEPVPFLDPKKLEKAA